MWRVHAKRYNKKAPARHIQTDGKFLTFIRDLCALLDCLRFVLRTTAQTAVHLVEPYTRVRDVWFKG